MYLVDRSNGTFTTQELARLVAYRAAVAAGFYTDWDGSAGSTDVDVLAGLHPGDGTSDGEAYPFTPEERQRLQQYRAAFAEGGFADDRPPAAASATSDNTSR